MITINEAAKSHEYNKEKNSISSVINKSTISSFKAGVEFAQQWISVKDEFPENQDIVLVKTDKQCICTAYFHGKNSGFITYGEDAFFIFGSITHWRPIEFK